MLKYLTQNIYKTTQNSDVKYNNLFLCPDIENAIKTHGCDKAADVLLEEIEGIIFKANTKTKSKSSKNIKADHIYIVFEGLQPWGKMLNERLLNFKDDLYSKQIHSIKTTWQTGIAADINNINMFSELTPFSRFWSSPGSPFYLKLCKMIIARFDILDDCSVITGEAGEVISKIKKIVNDFQEPKTNLIISNDPMIYTHLLLDNSNHIFYLNNISIEKLKSSINQWICKLNKKSHINYKDIAVISILFGTNFTPSFLMLSLSMQSIERVVKEYLKTSSSNLMSHNGLNISELYCLFNTLAKIENQFIIEKLQTNHARKIDMGGVEELTREHISILEFNSNIQNTCDIEERIAFGDSNWEMRYYNHHANMIYREEINQCVESFLNNLKWQFLYYSGIPKTDQETYYSYSLAPLFNSIILFESYGQRPIFYSKIPKLSMHQQFYLMVPSLGYNLIPDKLKTNPNIGYYFPLECDIYSLGENERKNCIPRIPLNVPENLLSILLKV